MALKWAKGKYTVQNPDKYIGKRHPTFRSSWELSFMTFCDNHPSVLQWASESLAIPYRNPLTNKISRYVPDFMIVYLDKDGNKKVDLIEIKPSSETGQTKTKSQRTAYVIVKNQAKWAAAQAYCGQAGMNFRILTEHDMFHMGQRKWN